VPIVTIKILSGRTLEQKRGVAKDVTEAIVKNLGCPASAVHIDIQEMSQENYAQGGKLFSDGR
jgi:4-oxalocrotonate tautomerase